MKKIYILFLAVIIALNANAQWTYLSAAATTTVRATYFLNTDTGFCADFAGGIHKTVDGGNTWTNPSSGVTVQLRGIAFIDESTGFICGGGVLLKTTDGGDTWVSVTSPSAATMRAIQFVNPDTGFIAGSAGVVFRTYDGGGTWSSYTLSQTTSDIIQLHMADANTGYLVCSNSTFLQGYIYKTVDGGDSWSQVYSESTAGYLGLAVVDADTVYAGGYGQKIIKTTDGGSTWSSVYTGAITTAGFRAGFAASSEKIFMVDDNDYILSTTDAGATWNDTIIGAGGLFSIFFPNENLGYTADGIGAFYEYIAPCVIPDTPGSIIGSNILCSGDTVAYFVDTVANTEYYDWKLPEGSTIVSGDSTHSIVIVVGTNSGSISVAAVNNCGEGVASITDVTVNITPPVPTIDFVSGVLQSSAASGNQWYYAGNEIPGATDQSYTPTQNGDYYVIVSVNGCSAQSETFTVIGLSVNNITNSLAMTIMPNPMNQSAQINISASDAKRILISDVQGKVIMNLPVTSAQFLLSKKDFSAGIYSVQLMNDKNELISRAKLIVQ